MNVPTHARNLLVAGMLSLCGSCGGAKAPSPQVGQTATSDEAPDASAGEGNDLVAMMGANVASTDLSALVKITSVRVEGPNGQAPATSGYVNHVYVVDIVTPIYGCGAARSLTFAEMADADATPRSAGSLMVVSVCRAADGRFHTPDNGYALPADDIPAGAVTNLAASPPPRGDSVCEP